MFQHIGIFRHSSAILPRTRARVWRARRPAVWPWQPASRFRLQRLLRHAAPERGYRLRLHLLLAALLLTLVAGARPEAASADPGTVEASLGVVTAADIASGGPLTHVY